MTTRMNITCDWQNPRTFLDRTAAGMMDAVTATTGRVLVRDVDAAILRHGGRVNLKADAIKALHNGGHTITCRKARHLSSYLYIGTASEYEEYRLRLVDDGYSQTISTVRLLAGAVAQAPSDPLIASVHATLELAAINLGRMKVPALSTAEVLADCQVI